MSTIHSVPIDQLSESPTNPRKAFTGLEELAASIRESGVLQPVLVRTKDGNGAVKFELVAGARRLRASKLAGLKALPAIIRKMTDEEVVDLQLVENIQREDMHPMDEAEALSLLVKRKDATTANDPAATVAQRLGKPKAYVVRRLRLLNLPKDARVAFRAGAITLEAAMSIARMGDEKTRAEVSKDILALAQRGEFSTHAATDIAEDRAHDLNAAPFDKKDAALYAEAGACGPCPKRTGNAPDLFSDVTRGDLCTDGSCFRVKVAADWKKKTEKAKAAGHRILTDKEAAAALDDWQGVKHESGFIGTDSNRYDSKKGTSTPYAKLLGKTKPTPILAKHPKTGLPVTLWDRKEVESLVRKLNPKVAKAVDTEAKQRKLDNQKTKAKQHLDDDYAEVLMQEIKARAHSESTNAGQLLRAAVIAVAAYPGGLSQSLMTANIQGKGLAGVLGCVDARQLALCLLALGTDDFAEDGKTGMVSDFMDAAAQALGIDTKKVRAQVIAEAKIETDKHAKPAKKAGAK